MGWFDDRGIGIEDFIPAYAIGDALDITGKHAAQGRDKYFQDELTRRAQQKRNQLALLQGRRAPAMAPEMESRLKALEAESQPGPLVADPEFQGYRANMVQGGRQALASVQNRQKAAGVGGGFANTGSMQNVYDRIGAQLAQLGQRQTERKESKRDAVAQARQAFTDAQTQHQNAIVDAQIAIEAGDAQALNDAYSRIYAAGVQADQARKSMIVGMGTAALGAMSGNPLAAGAGAAQVAQAQQGGGGGYTVGGATGLYDSNPFGVKQGGFMPAYQFRGYGK